MSHHHAPRSAKSASLLPLGALAAGFGLASAALAQTAPPAKDDNVLPTVRARASAEPQGKDAYQATETRIGKGKQDIRDIPQSLTVVTEKLIDDRNFDNVKEVLKNTAGISFQAAEGGEEDIKIHGISLQSTGDIFIDGMRDPAFYDRDTFFLDKIELLRGSASLLFGRGSTGGAVNQVTKQAILADQNQIDVTMASHAGLRATADFNKRLGETTALRVAAMSTSADTNGAGTRLDKQGLAASLRTGIDDTDEFGLTLYALENRNGVNYGIPWIRPTATAPATTAPASTSTLTPIDPDTSYGMASDRNYGSAHYAMAHHVHRFSPQTEVLTKVRYATYTRDLRASLARFAAASLQPGGQPVTLATLSPSTVLTRSLITKRQDMQTLTAQSDLNTRFTAAGMEHTLQTGVDFSREKKQVFGTVGTQPAKPNTLLGTPRDGASYDESQRAFRTTSNYASTGYGGYVQDLVQVAPMWKVLAGLRYDRLSGDYSQYSAATPPVKTSYRMTVSEWSQRAAVLFQPNEQLSFHLMGATSFNTSGDTYSLGAATADVPPEKSINIELGAKWDSADGRLSARAGVFRATKLHERNTDPLNNNVIVLSGKRHAAGLDVDLVGRITPEWEVFGNFTWMPVATIDIGAQGAEGQGTRPSLTPQYSGSLWTTYQFTPQLRLGAGLNGRSSQQPNRNPGFYAPKFVTADIMAEYAVLPDQLIFKLNVNNVANKRYADQLYTSFYVPGTGRITSLTGTYKF